MAVTYTFTLTILSVIGLSSAGFYWGGCPDVTVKSDFVVDRYLGVWHEIARYSPNWFEDDNSRCTQAVYSASEKAGVIDVVNSAILPDGTLDAISGTATIPDPNEPAKLAVKFFRFQPAGPYWVLDTDYDRYSLVHSCQDFFGICRVENNWFLSHFTQLDQSTIDLVHAKFQEQGIDLEPFILTNQDGCEADLGNNVL